MKKGALTYQRETTPDSFARHPEPAASPSLDDPAKPTPHGLLRSFRFAGEGFLHVACTQRNFRLQLIATALAIGAAVYCRLSVAEWVAILLASGLVLTLEMLNTAIEALVDMVTDDYHPLAKVAKDVAAASVLMAVLFALAVGGVVFGPRAWVLCHP